MEAVQEEKLYVAVPEKSKEGMSILRWVLRNAPKDGRIVITHVYMLDQMIPTPLGGRVRPSIVSQVELTAYRKEEKAKVARKLDDYAKECSKAKFKCEKLVFGGDNIAKGILELISMVGIKKLIMGAAADRYYSMSMIEPTSNTANSVMKKADPSCKIWFICKGDVICIRDANQKKLINSLSVPCSCNLNQAVNQERYSYKYSRLSPGTSFRVSDTRSSFITEVDGLCDDVELEETLSEMSLYVQKVRDTYSTEKQRMVQENEYLTTQLNERDTLMRDACRKNRTLENRVKELEQNAASVTDSINSLQAENTQLKSEVEEIMEHFYESSIQKMVFEECCKELGESLVAQLLENKGLQQKREKLVAESKKFQHFLIINDY